MPSLDKKVMVIGLDGAPFDLLYKYAINKNILKNIKNLFLTGSYGILKSTLPPTSPVAWSSFLTGKNPGKHGVFGFIQNKSGKPHSSLSIQGHTLPEILSKNNKKSILLNVPWTSPPFKINGIMVSGIPSPLNIPKTFPNSFVNIFNKNVKDYLIDIELPDDGYSGISEKEFLRQIYHITKKREEATIYLMNNYDWDFFMTVFTSLDRMNHVYYGYISENKTYNNKNKENILLNYYIELDKIIGNIISSLNEETYVILVSDHGFEPLLGKINLNILVDKFLTQQKLSGTGNIRKLLSRKNMKNFIKKYDLYNKIIKYIIPEKLLYKIEETIPEGMMTCNMIPYININIDNDNLKHDYINKFIKYVNNINKENDEKYFEKINYTKDVYNGTFINQIGELMIIMKDGYLPQKYGNNLVDICYSDSHSLNITGTHMNIISQRGFYAIIGPNIKNNNRTDENIINMAPTILDIFNITKDKDIDGIISSFFL